MTTMTASRVAAPVAGADRRSGKYLAFHLGKEEFGIQVMRVREIMGVQDITAVPHTPHYTKGVINLRGKVIPVIDLRLKFGLAEEAYTHRTCIIVVQVKSAETAPGAGQNQGMLMGIVVDGVSEVLNLTGADVEDTPDFGAGVETQGILGMAKIKGKVKILLDIDHVLTGTDLSKLAAALQ